MNSLPTKVGMWLCATVPSTTSQFQLARTLYSVHDEKIAAEASIGQLFLQTFLHISTVTFWPSCCLAVGT